MNKNDIKYCKNCRQNKLIIEYYKPPNNYKCKICVDADNKKYRDKNKGKGEYSCKSRKCNVCKKYKKLNLFYKSLNGYYRKYCQECYEKNISLEQHRLDYILKDNHKKSDNRYKRKRKKSNPESVMYNSAKNRARTRNLEFNLELSDITIPEYCPVLGIKLVFGIGKRSDFSPSLDRINSSKGYIKGNVKVISARANQIKSNGTIEEHERIIAYMRSAMNKVDCEQNFL